jgi:DNA-binding Xre family transcriptional regulator
VSRQGRLPVASADGDGRAGLFQTTELVPLLAERGVTLSREQVYRLVTKTPQRLNLQVLAALCDILEVTPDELVEPYRQTRKGSARHRRGVAAPAAGTCHASTPDTGHRT